MNGEQQAATSPAASGDAAPQPEPSGLTVFVVDDDPGCREVTARLLQVAGHRVRTAASVQEAMAQVADLEIGMMITDLWMPGGNGMQLVAQLAAVRPDLEVIVFTGHATAVTRQTALDRGCLKVIDKPNIDELLEAVRQHLGSDREVRLAGEGRLAEKPRLGRVLLVDDHPEVLRAVAAMLSKRGCETVAAGDGAEALERFAPGAFDLVVMDINMPRLDGVGATRELHRRDPAVSILLMSGEATSDQVFAAMSAGARTLLTKPINFTLLAERVGEYIAETRRRRRVIAREQERRGRSLATKTGRWLVSPRTARSRRKVAVWALVVLLAVVSGLGATAMADWALNSSRLTIAFIDGLNSRLDRLEGYLKRDEQRELDRSGREEQGGGDKPGNGGQ
jgi:DNA-binding NtrC family response regulator